MELNLNFGKFEIEPAATMTEIFELFLSNIPAPSEMTNEQLDQVGEVLAQVSMDVLDAFHVLQAEEQRRGTSNN